MSETTDSYNPQEVANLTLAHLRRIESQLAKMMDVMLRHETRLGRIERDVNEVKSDLVLLENRLLTQTNELLQLVQRMDESTFRELNPAP